MAKIDFTRERTYGKSFDGILKLQGHVSSEENLPLSAEKGDVYSVGEGSALYIFNNSWIPFSGESSDWNVNDPSAVGYIANRPFYEEVVPPVIHEYTELHIGLEDLDPTYPHTVSLDDEHMVTFGHYGDKTWEQEVDQGIMTFSAEIDPDLSVWYVLVTLTTADDQHITLFSEETEPVVDEFPISVIPLGTTLTITDPEHIVVHQIDDKYIPKDEMYTFNYLISDDYWSTMSSIADIVEKCSINRYPSIEISMPDDELTYTALARVMYQTDSETNSRIVKLIEGFDGTDVIVSVPLYPEAVRYLTSESWVNSFYTSLDPSGVRVGGLGQMFKFVPVSDSPGSYVLFAAIREGLSEYDAYIVGDQQYAVGQYPWVFTVDRTTGIVTSVSWENVSYESPVSNPVFTRTNEAFVEHLVGMQIVEPEEGYTELPGGSDEPSL